MKKLISIVISIALMSGMTVYAVDYGEELKNMPQKTYEQKFLDVPTSHWAFGYIAELVNDNVLSGYPDGKFYPNNNVTRAEFAKIMISASGVKVSPATSTSFSDVATTDWYCPYIESAKEFLTGYNYGGSAMYLPNKAAIREDIAVALVKLKGYDISVADLGMLSTMFSDYESISENAKRYVAVAVARGLVSGYEDGTFKGQQSITRAEASTLIWRANQYGADNKVLASETETLADNSNNTNEQTDITEETSQEEKAEEPVKEEKKPYVINILASADVKDSDFMTMDNSNNIYYIEKSDNCIYKLDASSGKKTKFFDTRNISLKKTEKKEDYIEEEVTEIVIDEETGEEKVKNTESKNVVVAEYSNFKPRQIKYDTIANKLILSGIYTVLAEPYKSPKTGEYGVIYDITEKNEKILYVGKDFCYYGTMLNSNTAQIYSDYDYHSEYAKHSNLNITTGDISAKNEIYVGNKDFRIRNIFKAGNNIYAFVASKDNLYSALYGELYAYNFSSSEYGKISETVSYSSSSQKGNDIYFWYKDMFVKTSLSTGEVSQLIINTKSENVEFADMGSMSDISEVFFVIDDDKIIFYDYAMKAFRLLQKNQ